MKLSNLKYEFSAEKNQQLVIERGISFEEVISAISEGFLVDTLTHYNKIKYPNQEIYLVEIRGYLCLVPFVRKDEQTIFLKTILPSRKLTKMHLNKGEGAQ